MAHVMCFASALYMIAIVNSGMADEECFMGMKSGLIPDSAITAYSYRVGHEPHEARLENGTLWAQNSWATQILRIDLGSMKNVSGIITPPFGEIGVDSYYVHCGTEEDWIYVAQHGSSNVKFFSTSYNRFQNRVYNRFPKIYSCDSIGIVITSYVPGEASFSLELVDGECFNMTIPWNDSSDGSGSGNSTDLPVNSFGPDITNAPSLTAEDVDNVTSYLTWISTSDRQFSEEEVEEVAEISSSLIEFYQQNPVDDSHAEEKQEVVKSISRIARKVDLSTTDGSSFTKTSKYINIEVRDETGPYSPYTFDSTFYHEERDYRVTTVPMTITIPVEAFNKTQRRISSSAVRVVAVGYRTSNLFPSDGMTNWVISCSLGDTTDSVEGITLTDEKVIFTNNGLPKPKKTKINDFKVEKTELECVFWDFEIGDWSDEGCSLSKTSPPFCQCNHLTNFAMLVSRSIIPADFALTIVTYIGCGLSIICLLVTLIMICLSENLRSKYQMKILGNICLCLAVSFTIFIFGVDALNPDVGCSVVTVLMHYFFLSAWFWTSIYSYIIYRDIVRVIASYGRGYRVRYAAAGAYGIPLVIVSLNASLALGLIDEAMIKGKHFESSYRAPNFCWLHKNSLYFGFLLVVGVLLLFNIGVFCVVIPKVTCKRRKVQSSKDTGVGKSVVTMAALVTTMGLSWIFGYLMLVSDNHAYLHAMSWLFTIVNAFQGVFIFYFTAIRSGELVRLCTRSRSRFYSVTTNSSRASLPMPENTASSA